MNVSLATTRIVLSVNGTTACRHTRRRIIETRLSTTMPPRVAGAVLVGFLGGRPVHPGLLRLSRHALPESVISFTCQG